MTYDQFLRFPYIVVVVLGFYVPPTAIKIIRRWDIGLKSHPKRLEKPGIKLMTSGL